MTVPLLIPRVDNDSSSVTPDSPEEEDSALPEVPFTVASPSTKAPSPISPQKAIEFVGPLLPPTPTLQNRSKAVKDCPAMRLRFKAEAKESSVRYASELET